MTESKKSKFTLMELILIICIVAILAVIFLHFLNIKKEDSRKILCMNNLKNLGMAIRMYSQEYKGEFLYRPGRAGFEMLRVGGYCENSRMYTCPSTNDEISDGSDLTVSQVSYMYANGLNEATSVDSGLARDRDANHSKYGNVLFVDWHAQGFAGANWTASENYLGSSNFSY